MTSTPGAPSGRRDDLPSGDGVAAEPGGRTTERDAAPGSAPGPATRPIRRLVLATDLTPASAIATERAFELAGGLHASLLVLTVIDPGAPRLVGGRAARIDEIRADRERELRGLAEQAARRRIELRTLIWQGDPGESIVEAAVAEEADLIVVGSRGRTGLGRAILGSVSDHVVHHAHVPVLVVRGDESRSVRPS